jgi:hypothetical protein
MRNASVPKAATGARRWKAEDAAYRVLALADRLVPLGVPERALEEWKSRSSAFTVSDTEARLAEGHLLIASRSVHIAKIEKAFSVFMLTGNYRERVLAWAMTWVLTFWPKASELPKLVPGASGPKARLLAPVRCWNALARDYGQAALGLITLMNAGIVLRETLLRPFKRDGGPIREHPAAKLLEVLE